MGDNAFLSISCHFFCCAEFFIWFFFRVFIAVAGFFIDKMEALVAGALKHQEAWDVFAFKAHGFAPMGGRRFPGDKIMDAMSAVNSACRHFCTFGQLFNCNN